jgi:anthranilate phosphoribosyltransferase
LVSVIYDCSILSTREEAKSSISFSIEIIFMLKSILQKPSLITPEITYEITKDLMNGKLSPAQIGAFLTFLKLLGLETEPEHIVQVAKAMQEASLDVKLLDVVDIVGTGGDGQDTFNVSTASSIVVAGAGVKVAKVLYL